MTQDVAADLILFATSPEIMHREIVDEEVGEYFVPNIALPQNKHCLSWLQVHFDRKPLSTLIVNCQHEQAH